MLYDSGVLNLDAKTSSGGYHADVRKFYTRSYGQLTTWWRMIYESRDKQWLSVAAFSAKSLWQMLLHLVLGVAKCDFRIPVNYIKGMKDAVAFVRSDEYKDIPSYIIPRK